MYYKSVIYINFVEEQKYKMITADGYGAEDVVKNISRIDPSKKFIEKETLIIFDEIQEFADIATTLKFFKLDGRYDVICSGSMLGINYKKIQRFYIVVQFYNLRNQPMSKDNFRQKYYCKK